MRLVFLLMITAIVGLTCGPDSTETIAGGDNGIRLSGTVVYLDSPLTGAPEVWVVYGFEATDSTDSVRLDSVMTDRQGEFLMEGVTKGDIFWEIYREPRRDCYGTGGQLSLNAHATGLKWVYEHGPRCENYFTDTTDSM